MKNTAEHKLKQAELYAQELLTKKELSRRLKICSRMVELMVNDGRIPVVRLGTAVRYNWNAVLAALENN